MAAVLRLSDSDDAVLVLQRSHPASSWVKGMASVASPLGLSSASPHGQASGHAPFVGGPGHDHPRPGVCVTERLCDTGTAAMTRQERGRARHGWSARDGRGVGPTVDAQLAIDLLIDTDPDTLVRAAAVLRLNERARDGRLGCPICHRAIRASHDTADAGGYL